MLTSVVISIVLYDDLCRSSRINYPNARMLQCMLSFVMSSACVVMNNCHPGEGGYHLGYHLMVSTNVVSLYCNLILAYTLSFWVNLWASFGVVFYVTI
jgi:hypothetical protein